MSLFTDDYFVLDYETGGFAGTPGFRPVEAALLTYRGGVVTLRHHVVDPTDDPSFFVSPGAEDLHHIGMTKIAAEGVPAKHIAEGLQEKFAALPNLPIWGHNCVQFDRLLLERECDRYRLDKPNPFRWRDSAALYKAHKMAVAQLPDERYFEYFARVLGMRRRGLYFSLKHVLETEKLGISVENVDVAPVVVVDPSLGVPQAVADEVVRLGAHRAAFDVLVTHALIQKMQADPSYRNLCL
jgi:DNA polymerase III epsilon subunit-like protein